MRTLNGAAAHLSEQADVLGQPDRTGYDYRGHAHLQTSSRHWYALQTYSRHEKRVHKELGLRDFESFLPLYGAAHRWKNGCPVRVELPLFPGYLFVRIAPRDRFGILGFPGAISVVGSASGPWPIPNAEIAGLRASLQSCNVGPYPYPAVGQKVRIKSGPLANLTGILVRHSGGFRVVLSVELIRRAAAVEVKADEVEPFTGNEGR